MIKDIKKFESCSKRVKIECICDYCGNFFERTKNNLERSYKHLKKDSCDKKECIQKKKKEIFNLKYGCDNPFQSESIKEKIKQQNLLIYGVENSFQRKEIQEKQKQTLEKKYKVDHYSKTEECKNKVITTNIERYGSPYPSHKYGKTQDEIKDWLNNFGFNFSSDYEILENKEIDLLDKNLKIGIEFCGLYWHNELSPEPRDHKYHINKYKKCLSKGIQLLTIFEDEWKLRQDQCKSHIKSVLRINSKKIFARKCEIKEINKEEAKLFLDYYHIQGSNKLGIIFFGLFFENELCAVMSLGKHNRQLDAAKKEIILDRLCFKDEYSVIGGSSKLFKACLKWAAKSGYKKIISFSDNRWSLGKVYEKMGFILEKEYGADYSYVDIKNPRKRISKQSQKNSMTNCPKGLTEYAWATQRGLARIYDCGKKRWIREI